MSIKIAILDFNNGKPNQGMRCILDIVSRYSRKNQMPFVSQVFDVRAKNEVPDTDFDIYLCSGGPGSPLEDESSAWENNFYHLIDQLEEINNDPSRPDKKYAFFICHSFQLICRKYKLGKISKRKSTSFGIFPIPLTAAGQSEEILSGLSNPIYAVDSRDWQVTEPDEAKLEALGAKVLALEKERPHVNLKQCLMAIRFNDYFFGTQFHPEADPAGMKELLLNEEKKNQIIEVHGPEKYLEMMQFLEEPEKLERTQNKIIPAFLDQAIHAMQEA